MVVPPATPVTTPVPETTVATAVLLLVHEPPPASVSAVVNPGHTFVVPVIDDGNGLTVTVVFVVQPVGKVYTMVDVPASPAVTIPELVPIVATDVLLLVQVPPPAAVSAVVMPAQTVAVPVMADGKGFMVTVDVVLQPLDAATNVIVAVPADTPVSVPVIRLIPAIDELLLVQVPRPAASLNVVVEPLHMARAPRIAGGAALTETVVVTVLPDVKLIVAVPAATPVTTPVPLPTVATEVLLLVQLPQPVASVSVVVAPTHTVVVPEIGATVSLIL